MHLAQAQRRVAWAAAAWAAALGLWLAWAYALEHCGAGAFLGVWAASLAFLAAHALLLCQILAALIANDEHPEDVAQCSHS